MLQERFSLVCNHPVPLCSTPQEGQGIARQNTSPCLLQPCSCSPPPLSQPGTKSSAQASHSCIHAAHNHPISCKGIVCQSLARDWRFVTSIVCIYWRRAGPRLLWENPSSLLRVPQLMEGLIDLLITIMLFFFARNGLLGMQHLFLLRPTWPKSSNTG